MSDDQTTSLVADRRRFRRQPADLLPGLRASILAGPDVDVVDISQGGLLIESDVRMTPGVGICLSLAVDHHKYMVGGRICRVDAVLQKSGIRYRAAVALDEELAIFEPPAGGSAAEERDAIAIEATDHAAAGTAFDSSFEEECLQLREQLGQLRRERELQEQAIDQLREAVLSGEALRREVAEHHAAEQALWRQEREVLQERVLLAEAQAAESAQQLNRVRDEEHRIALEHAQERSRLETSVREYAQQLAEVRAAHAALAAGVDQRLEAYERERAASASKQHALTSQLDTTAGWCAEQQDLLYRLRQQMSSVFALLYGAPPAIAVESAPQNAAAEVEGPPEIETPRVAGILGDVSEGPAHRARTSEPPSRLEGTAVDRDRDERRRQYLRAG